MVMEIQENNHFKMAEYDSRVVYAVHLSYVNLLISSRALESLHLVCPLALGIWWNL